MYVCNFPTHCITLQVALHSFLTNWASESIVEISCRFTQKMLYLEKCATHLSLRVRVCHTFRIHHSSNGRLLPSCYEHSLSPAYGGERTCQNVSFQENVLHQQEGVCVATMKKCSHGSNVSGRKRLIGIFLCFFSLQHRVSVLPLPSIQFFTFQHEITFPKSSCFSLLVLLKFIWWW